MKIFKKWKKKEEERIHYFRDMIANMILIAKDGFKESHPKLSDARAFNEAIRIMPKIKEILFKRFLWKDRKLINIAYQQVGEELMQIVADKLKKGETNAKN